MEIVQVLNATKDCFKCKKPFNEGDRYKMKHLGNEPTEWAKRYPKRLDKWYRDFGGGANLLVHEDCAQSGGVR